MEVPAASWSFLVLQIPLAVLVAVLSYYFIKTLKEIIQDFLKQLNEQALSHQVFIASQNELNRDFIRNVQESHSQSMARLAEEIKKIGTDNIKELAELTRGVDAVVDKVQLVDYVLTKEKRL